MKMNSNYDVKSVLVSARIHIMSEHRSSIISVHGLYYSEDTCVAFTEPRPNPLAASSFSISTVTELLAHFVSELSTTLHPNYQ
jgi:hypothetical protein